MMSILQRLSKLPQNLYCFTNIQRYPKRNESFLSASRQSSLLKTIFKASLVGISIGFPVGIIITTGYSWYINKKAAKTYHLEGKEKKIKVLQEKPSVPVSREVVSPMDSTELKLTLFQYQTCPFCCKVRVFLDYYGISYDIVEVDPVLRKEISWSSYKKVPILLAQIDSGYQPLNDSSMIVSLLASYLKDRSQKINDLVEYYPSIAMHDENQKLKYEIMNKYFLMYKENLISDENINEVIEERKWRQWVDDEFVHTLSPNVYRTLSEAYKTFNWFSEVGKWEEYFPMWERLIIINIGAIAMWFISKRLKKRHNLKDDVRQSLYDEINKWLYAIKKHGGTFMGGKKPNLSDLAVYGILKSIEGCSAFKDALENTKLCTWYDAMTKEVETHSGSKYLIERSRTPPQSLTISRLSPTTLSHTSVKSEVASANGNCQTNAMIEKEEIYIANLHNTYNVQENIERNNIFMDKDRQSTFIEESTEDSFEESSEDENELFIDNEKNEIKLKDEYFTKGKYITYFFLEMERQFYNPFDVYNMVQYHDSNTEKPGKEGENSSSGSISPNVPAYLRQRLIHRRSVDNLVGNSPTNSMRHSSPESIKSAPVQLKPRSTSHDALSKKKERHQSQTTGASMDSLAKQALLAAQVLNLIPTQKARERNFLHGRIAANSLLGPVELEKVLPNRELKIFIGTWNMNGQNPPKELNDFMLPSDIETVPDLLAIGTQESCSERSEWEAALQETLGPSHVLLYSTGLGTLHLALFLRRDLIWFCSIPEDASFSTRTGTAFRTKGAVAIALMLFGTSFLFVTAHLTAHQDKVKERVNDIKRIVRNLDLPKDLPIRHKSKDVTQNFDCIFWCGDLNFRLAQPREEVIQWVTDTCFPQQLPVNLHKDQLQTILNEGAVLRGFEEAPITFPPTYKYDPGTQNFDSSSKQRTPAYTDRILFKGKGHTRGYIRRVSHESSNSYKDGIIECLVYDSVPSICTSDHKPVWGVFKTTIRPGIDTIPLGGGLFNREIYLEGIKRRAAAMDESHGTSKVCLIQ